MPVLSPNQARVSCRACGWAGIRVKPGARLDGKEEARGFGACHRCGQDDLVSATVERELRQLAKAKAALAEHGEGMMDANERARLLEMGGRLKGMREGSPSPVGDREFWRCLGILMSEVALAGAAKAKAPTKGA